MSIKINIQHDIIFDNGKVKNIDFKYNNDKPTILALSGQSGSGKTTILKIIAGLIDSLPQHIDNNHITLHGINLLALPLKDRKIGYIDQNNLLFPHLSAIDNLCFALQFNDHVTPQHDLLSLNSLIENLDLHEIIEHQSIHTLSEGQKQRLTLARALISQPQLLLLDEALNANDSTNRSKCIDFLHKVNYTCNTSMIYTSHYDSELKKACFDYYYIS